MMHASGGRLSPTAQYSAIQGRAAEIARAMGSPAVGPEHLFLGILHGGGPPVSAIAVLVDPGQAEEAVLSLLSAPGYSPPAPPVRAGLAPLWGVKTAADLGDSHFGASHALLAMIRERDTVPARALAGLTDLDALEALILETRSGAADGPPAAAVFLPEDQELDDELTRSIADALPADSTFGFNTDAAGRVWICVIGPGNQADTAIARTVVNTALASLGRPSLSS
jgi:hypothetical protein